MLKRGDRGAAVKRLQDALIELGEALPRWGNDGDLGGETLAAVTSFLVKHGRASFDDPDPTAVDDAELAAIYAMADLLRKTKKDAPLNVIDRTAYAGLTWDQGPRPWTQVYGWCLHQTAAPLHTSRDLARCDKIGAHWVVYPDGRKFKLHEANRRIVHGHGWNTSMIGIEISGLFAGCEGDPSTVWDNPETPYKEQADTLTADQINAVIAIIRYDYQTIVAHGGKPAWMVSHRQSSDQRRSDPGSAVWQRIGIPMMLELKLTDGGPGYKIGSGAPNPEKWDPSRKGIRY
jgi:peptidoglycan hydrolase-like protein with peptidoglycan-binding domain